MLNEKKQNHGSTGAMRDAVKILQDSSRAIATTGNSNKAKLLYLLAEKTGLFRPFAEKAQHVAIDAMAGNLREAILEIMSHVTNITEQLKVRGDALDQLTAAYEAVMTNVDDELALGELERILLQKVYANIPNLETSSLEIRIQQLLAMNPPERRALLLEEARVFLEMSKATVNALFVVAQRASAVFKRLQYRYAVFLELKDSVLALGLASSTVSSAAQLGISSHEMLLATIHSALAVAQVASEASSLQATLEDQQNAFITGGKTNGEILLALVENSQALVEGILTIEENEDKASMPTEE